MKKRIALLLTLIVLLAMTACSKNEVEKDVPEASAAASSSGEPVELEIWLQGNNVGDPSLSEDQWWITKAIAEFEKENPNITVELTLPSGQVEITQTYKAACLAGTAPDIVNLWSGTNLFELSDLVLDPTPYISEEDFSAITSWNECYYNFDSEQKLLGIPAVEPGKNAAAFFYNKTIFNEVGIDLEANPIENTDDLEAVLQQLQDAGYQPISCDDEGYGVMFSTMGIWWANAVGSEGMYANSIGESKFADDEVFRGILVKAKEWYQKGYINPDYATCTESLSNFLQGKAAILVGGTWYLQDLADSLGAENVGVLSMGKWSDADKYSYAAMGGNGQVFCISKSTEHPAEAAALIEFLNSREQAEKAQEQQLVLPVRTDVSYPFTGGLYDEVAEIINNSVLYFDNTLRADVVTEFYRIWPLVVTGYTTVDEAIAALDSIAANGS